MSRLPAVSGRRVIAVLEQVGYTVVRQKGSHVRMRCSEDPRRRPTSVPLHREVRRGTLKGILNDADLTRDQFLNMLG